MSKVKTIKTNSGMLTGIDVGMYETALDPLYVRYEHNDFDNDIDIDINMQSYKSELAETIEAYYHNVKFWFVSIT